MLIQALIARWRSAVEFIDGCDYPTHGITPRYIAKIQKLVRPHRHDGRVRSILLPQDFGGPPDIDFFHGTRHTLS
jgi:hypothetical protein